MNHNIRSEDTPEWRVIHYMAKVHQATKEQIEQNTGVDGSVIAKLAMKKPPIIVGS
jgi:hypothetical protein